MRKVKSIKLSRFLIILFLLLALIFLIGCENKQKSDWEKAQKENTISSYEEFLKQYPQSKFAEEARSRIEVLKKERHPSFRDAKRARIIIKESYGEAKNFSLAPEVIQITSWLLKHAGIDVITEESSEYDFTIKVNIIGEALSAFYVGPHSGTHYTGADVKGIIVFEAKDGHKISEKFGDRIDPPKSIIGKYTTPADAPFSDALFGTYGKTIKQLVHKSLGFTPLISALKDDNSDVRKAAAEALGKIKDPRAVEPLISALKDEWSEVREAASEALKKIDPNWEKSDAAKNAVPEFISALRDENWLVREAASKVLKKIDPNWEKSDAAKNAVPEFISALRDRTSEVREAAAEALGEIKDPRAVEPLISALRDRNWKVRSDAAEALGEIKDPRAVEPLISALRDGDSFVRRAASEALGKIKDPRAVEPLISALRDGDSFVRRDASEALKKITGKDFGEDTEKWQSWWIKNRPKK